MSERSLWRTWSRPMPRLARISTAALSPCRASPRSRCSVSMPLCPSCTASRKDSSRSCFALGVNGGDPWGPHVIRPEDAASPVGEALEHVSKRAARLPGGLFGLSTRSLSSTPRHGRLRPHPLSPSGRSGMGSSARRVAGRCLTRLGGPGSMAAASSAPPSAGCPSKSAPGGKGDHVLGSLPVTPFRGCSWGADRSA